MQSATIRISQLRRLAKAFTFCLRRPAHTSADSTFQEQKKLFAFCVWCLVLTTQSLTDANSMLSGLRFFSWGSKALEKLPGSKFTISYLLRTAEVSRSWFILIVQFFFRVFSFEMVTLVLHAIFWAGLVGQFSIFKVLFLFTFLKLFIGVFTSLVTHFTF